MSVPVIVVPGINGSGERHWQTIWEHTDPTFSRFQPSSWDDPELDDWCDALERAIRATPSPPLLLAHSLGVLLIAHWSVRSDTPVAGGFLVAVPDPDGPAFPEVAGDFAHPPRSPLPFPTVLMATRNDPYASMDFAVQSAQDWGSACVDVGDLGHVNESSGVGEWRQGRQLFDSFRAPLDRG